MTFAIDFKEYSYEKEDGDLDLEYDTKKFFISHSSKDEKICKAFVVLLEELGVPEYDILFTSSDRHGVPGDEDIFEYLIHYLKNGITIFYMLSDNYYNSPYCLNEMGAAWVVKNDFSLFLLPNFTGGIKGVVDGNKKGYALNSVYNLMEIRDKILKIYGTSISEGKWEEVKKTFLSVIG